MDEILIDEKKYVSSKRAAKVTGYAKDYIGQLCREGRVPARLVGRSWYVLETAIHDHRFGKQHIEEEIAQKTSLPPRAFPHTWESPRYEAFPAEILPLVKRQEAPQTTTASEKLVKAEESSETEENEEGVNIPIHAIYEQPPEDLLPRLRAETELPGNNLEERRAVKSDRGNREKRVVKAFAALLTILSIALAAINTGYFDNYVLQSRQLNALAGISIYNK